MMARRALERPTLVSAHAYEDKGVNAIPEALADVMGRQLGWPVDGDILQVNVVSHTGADGWSRLSRPAAFDGPVVPGANYVLVDDFVGMGGTLANLKGHLESHGGHVLAAVALTGKPHSAKLAVTPERLHELSPSMDTISKAGGSSSSVTPSTRLLNQKLGTSPAPRTLTPSEIALLRQSKHEIAVRVAEFLLRSGNSKVDPAR